MSANPVDTQISVGVPPVWSVFTVGMEDTLTLRYPFSAQPKPGSDSADVQADLSIRVAHVTSLDLLRRGSCFVDLLM